MDAFFLQFQATLCSLKTLDLLKVINSYCHSNIEQRKEGRNFVYKWKKLGFFKFYDGNLNEKESLEHSDYYELHFGIIIIIIVRKLLFEVYILEDG